MYGIYVHTYVQWNLLSTYVPRRGHKICTCCQRYLLSGLVHTYMYMRYTQGQNEEYLLTRSMH